MIVPIGLETVKAPRGQVACWSHTATEKRVRPKPRGPDPKAQPVLEIIVVNTHPRMFFPFIFRRIEGRRGREHAREERKKQPYERDT